MSKKKYPLLILISLMILLLISCEKNVKPNWDTYVNNFVESYLKQNPDWASFYGRHEYDGQISDYSDKGIKARVEWFKNQKELTKEYNNEILTSDQILEKENILRVIDENIFFMETLRRPYNNSYYYFFQLAPSNYLEKNYAPLNQRMKSYIQYLKSMKIAIEQIQKNFINEPFLSRYHLEFAKKHFGGFADFMKNNSQKGFTEVKDEKLWDEFNKATKETVDKLYGFVEWINTQIPEASENFAMGAEKFSQMLYATDRLNIPLKELTKIVEDDLNRNLSAIKKACQKIYPNKSVKECIEKLRSQKLEYDPVAKANEQLPILKKYLEQKDIITVPNYKKLSVVKAPPFMTGFGAAINLPSPFDKEMEGFYYVENPNWPNKLHLSLLREKADLFTSIHEVWPGHFLQSLYFNNCKSILAKLFQNYTCLEGWAHYTEEMMYDEGFGNYQPEYEIPMRGLALIRNVRFLLAIKMHTEGMSLRQAEEFFQKFTFLNLAKAKQEVFRGTYDPQYYGYTLGKLLIRKLKKDWVGKTGSTNLKDFHNKFLSYGVIPIPLIEKFMMEEN